MKKVFLLSFALFLMIGCAASTDLNEDVSPETALPADMPLVIAVDYSDDDQVDMFEDLKNRFPDVTFMDKIYEEIEKELEDNIDVALLFSDLLSGEWKVVIGISSIDFDYSTYGAPADVPEMYVAMEFENADSFEELFELAMPENCDEELGCKVEEFDGVKYWTSEVDDMYAMRYGDLFVMASFSDGREDALERLANGGGFDTNSEYLDNIASQPNLGYVFMDSEGFGDVFDEVYAEWGEEFAKSVESFGDVYVLVTAEEDGLRFVSESTLIGDDPLAALNYVDLDYEPSLYERIPGDGVMIYLEQGAFGTYLNAFTQGFTAGYGAVGADLGIDSDLTSGFAKEVGVESEEMMAFLDAPFAFSIYDVGSYYPGFALFMDVNDVEVAGKVTEYLDTQVGVLTEELLIFVELQGGVEAGDGVTQVAEGDLHKLSVSWDGLPDDVTAMSAFVPGLTDEPIEFYYGLFDEETYVLALYPNLSEKDEGSFGDQELFVEAMENVGGLGYSFSYGSILPFMDLVDRYVLAAKGFGAVPDEDYEIYLEVANVLRTMPYMISSNYVEDEILKGDAFLGIKEVEN